jgi:c-di-GMP-related signal transduction protein
MPPINRTMEKAPLVFVARQPIFDAIQNVSAYELLYRSGPEDCYAASDSDFAMRSVLGHSLLAFNLAELTQRKRALINFTGLLLVQQTAFVLPPDKTVVEIGNTVEPDSSTVRACWALKRAGYQLALDGVNELSPSHPLLPIADYVKVDFLRTSVDQRRDIAQTLKTHHHTLVAQKVETREDHVATASLGFGLFQGNFFQKPEILSRQSVPSAKLASLQIVKELNQPDVDWDSLEQIFKQDVGLTLKLLRYLNSAWFGLSQHVESLRHAIILLGIRGSPPMGLAAARGDGQAAGKGDLAGPSRVKPRPRRAFLLARRARWTTSWRAIERSSDARPGEGRPAGSPKPDGLRLSARAGVRIR